MELLDLKGAVSAPSPLSPCDLMTYLMAAAHPRMPTAKTMANPQSDSIHVLALPIVALLMTRGRVPEGLAIPVSGLAYARSPAKSPMRPTRLRSAIRDRRPPSRIWEAEKGPTSDHPLSSSDAFWTRYHVEVEPLLPSHVSCDPLKQREPSRTRDRSPNVSLPALPKTPIAPNSGISGTGLSVSIASTTIAFKRGIALVIIERCACPPSRLPAPGAAVREAVSPPTRACSSQRQVARELGD